MPKTLPFPPGVFLFGLATTGMDSSLRPQSDDVNRLVRSFDAQLYNAWKGFRL